MRMFRFIHVRFTLLHHGFVCSIILVNFKPIWFSPVLEISRNPSWRIQDGAYDVQKLIPMGFDVIDPVYGSLKGNKYTELVDDVIWPP